MRRFAAWKRRQRSRIIFIAVEVPASWIAPAGLRHGRSPIRMIEVSR